jgi:hypothetical protein
MEGTGGDVIPMMAPADRGAITMPPMVPTKPLPAAPFWAKSPRVLGMPMMPGVIPPKKVIMPGMEGIPGLN